MVPVTEPTLIAFAPVLLIPVLFVWSRRSRRRLATLPRGTGWKDWWRGTVDWRATMWWQRELYALATGTGILIGLALWHVLTPWLGSWSDVLLTGIAVIAVESAAAVANLHARSASGGAVT